MYCWSIQTKTPRNREQSLISSDELSDEAIQTVVAQYCCDLRSYAPGSSTLAIHCPFSTDFTSVFDIILLATVCLFTDLQSNMVYNRYWERVHLTLCPLSYSLSPGLCTNLFSFCAFTSCTVPKDVKVATTLTLAIFSHSLSPQPSTMITSLLPSPPPQT